jgi:hypothetical protein
MIRTAAPTEHDPRLVRALRTWLTWGTIAVLLLPAARAQTFALGWLPLYLVAMPAVALWALHRFALPQWLHATTRAGQARRRRRAPQARRRERPMRASRHLRAA